MNWLKKIGIEIKFIAGALIGLLGFVLFFFIREKIRARDKLQFELKRLESELKIAELERDSKEKEKKIEVLKGEESSIREKIKVLEDFEYEQDTEVSADELDKFFKDRGF